MNKVIKIGDAITSIGSLRGLAEGAQMFMDSANSEATKRAYQSDWARFTRFCEDHKISPMPATSDTVCAYITDLAQSGLKVATIQRHLTTISQAHHAFKKTSPTGNYNVSQCLKGIKRTLGTAQKQAKALVWSDLVKVVKQIRPSFIGKRDRAMLLLGWAAALRRSELVALNREDIDFVGEGMIVTIRRSKTDQSGEGYKIGVPFAKDFSVCPTVCLKAWIEIAQLREATGPLFFFCGTAGKKFFVKWENAKRLGPRSVNTIIASRLKNANYDSAGYSGHSLRAGFITSAAASKVPEHLIQAHTRHRSAKVMRGYIRDGGLFNDNPASVIF